MKVLLLLFIVSTTLHANEISECGEYSLRGVVRPLKDGLTIVVNEKTQSEMQIKTTISESSKLGAFINKPVTANALLVKKFNGTKGFAEQVMNVDFRLPDPLNPKDTGVAFIKKADCKKD